MLAENRKGTIEAIVLRLSNGFGTPERADVDRWTLVVNDLCRQAATTKKMVMRSPGDDLRDFITLKDTARSVAHVLALDRHLIGDGLFNVGSGHSMRVRDIADMVADRCNAVLGFRPKMVRPESSATAEPFEYGINKIRATGFAVSADFISEIDATLKLCHTSFSTPE